MQNVAELNSLPVLSILLQGVVLQLGASFSTWGVSELTELSVLYMLCAHYKVTCRLYHHHLSMLD